MIYSLEGGPIEVTLDIDNIAQMAQIQVKDCGIGIPLHQQKLIFGRFIRADNAHAAGISGTGLGLYLCRALFEQHEGQIWFESEEGKRKTFATDIATLIIEAHQQVLARTGVNLALNVELLGEWQSYADTLTVS